MKETNAENSLPSGREAPEEPAPVEADQKDAILNRAVETLLRQSVFRLMAIALTLLFFVAMLDTATGAEISFSIFYLLPVAFAGGLVSRGAGQFMAMASAVIWGYLDITYGQSYSALWIPCWNALVRLGFFLLINELIGGLRDAYLRERMLSRTDGLTGIANTRVFEEYAEQTIALSRRNGLPFTIAYIDLDQFKQVNDQFGHSEGDRLLRAVALHIASCLRKTDTLARLGGDEFGLLLPDTGAEQAGILLGRIMTALTSEVGSRWPVGATIGAVTFTDPPDNIDYAVFQADALMYQGKAEGRGRVVQSSWPEYL